MSEGASVPWVVFERRDRSNARIVTTIHFREAIERGAEKLGRRVDQVDYTPVYPHETAEEAKQRVAGSVG